MHARWRWLGAAALALTTSAEPAEACGGTFCDSGPTAMPVDQTGENVFFVMEGGYVEAHVQIQYQGSADRFAWVVPMPEVPEVSVGSQLLFNALLTNTAPSYGSISTQDPCGSNCFAGAGGSSGTGAGGAGGSLAMDSGAGGGPTVVFSKTVGSFDVTALSGGTAQEVSDWLVANGYATVPTAPVILQDYVAKHFVFLALKLTGGADTNEIHPVVFRYPGTEPCIPLKLTAVAATEDMAVRAFFAGDDRVFPTNYKHVELNQARMDWLSQVANYRAVVSRAVDSAVANGRAFVTEFAGETSMIPTSLFYSPAWNADAFRAAPPEQIINVLANQGLGYCGPGYDSTGHQAMVCTFNHPLMAGLLLEFLPPPTGLTPAEFWSDLPGHVAQIDLTAWDAAAFADAVDQRIVEPGVHAAEVLARNPVLTRLFTVISPVEMTEDPEFAALPIPDRVDRRATFATQRFTCSGARGMKTPDGDDIGLGTGATWPGFTSQMPWAARIEEYSRAGQRFTLVDNRSKIKSELAEWNSPLGWPAPASPFPPATCSGGAGTSGYAGSAGSSHTASGGACSVGSDGTSESLVALGLLGCVAALRRKRRGRATRGML